MGTSVIVSSIKIKEKRLALCSDRCDSVGCQQTERSLARFLVRVYAWVSASVPDQGVLKRQPTDVSLSHRCFSPFLCPSLPLSLKINKYNLFFKKASIELQVE